MSTCNENQSSPALLAPDTILQSRYRVVRQIGKGGMGAVQRFSTERRPSYRKMLEKNIATLERMLYAG